MNKKTAIAMIAISLIVAQGSLAYYLLGGIPEEETEEPMAYFCPEDDCALVLSELINSARMSAHCAFYDIDEKRVVEALSKSNADVKLVVDNEHFYNVKGIGARKDDGRQLMHNKFCIIDERIVLTGSFNPTINGNNLNNNNAIIIASEHIAKNYENEFDELWKGDYGGGKKTRYTKVKLNGNLYENYFCPEDKCEKKIIKVLKSAKESIHFMAFSFTSEKISALLGERSKEIEVRGVIEKFQNGRWSKYDFLKKNGVDVKFDSNPKNMHHKVFIVDKSIVVFGSYNPTKSANTRNDENIIIAHDKNLTQKFMNEFYRVW